MNSTEERSVIYHEETGADWLTWEDSAIGDTRPPTSCGCRRCRVSEVGRQRHWSRGCSQGPSFRGYDASSHAVTFSPNCKSLPEDEQR
uniref:Uncharacterized protein n=1 Tax=Arundo donax TaxID=35708 RepID=A0A0A9DBK3_ARUDO